MKRDRGFTLIELMIVVAIVAIIAAVALPSYFAQVRDSKRTEGQVALMDLAQQLERCFTQDNSYNGASCPAEGANGSTESGYYDLEIVAASTDATTYTLTAKPTFDDPDCGTLTLTQTGSKTASGGGDCW